MATHEDEMDEEQGYLDPNDISVISNTNWEPTEEDVINYAIKLDFDVENDPEEFLEIAYNFLTTELPPNWKRAKYKKTGELLYINYEDDAIHFTTDLEEYAREMYEKEKQKYERHLQAEQALNAPKVAPRTKVPPIGQKGNEKEKKGSKPPKNLSKNKKEEAMSIKASNNSSMTSVVEGKSANENSFDQKKKQKTIESNPKTPVKQTKKADEMNIAKHSKYADVSPPKGIQKNYDKPFNPATTTIVVEELKENGYSPLNVKGNVDDEYNYSYSPISVIKESKKKEYYNMKLNEIKEYEKMLRDNYCKERDKYKQEKKQAKITLNEEYEMKSILSKRKVKDEVEHQIKSELESYEAELETRFNEECERIKAEVQREIVERENKFNPGQCREMISLQVEKNQIQEKIDVERLQPIQLMTKTEDINETKSLLEEKFQIEKTNLTKKYDLLAREYELKEEKALNEVIEHLDKANSQTLDTIDRQAQISQKKLLDDFQKALDDDYETSIRHIALEMEKNYQNELEKMKTQTEKEKTSKSVMYNNETSGLEKDYYVYVNKAKEENKKSLKATDAKVKEKFDVVIKNYEKLRIKITSSTEETIGNIINRCSDLNETDERFDNFYTIEHKLEEYVLNVLDENLLLCQKIKNDYELLEVEYKDKTLLLDYFVEIGRQFVQTLIDLPSNKIENEERIIKELLRFAKDKQSEYKSKYQLIKDKKTFNFLPVKPGEMNSSHVLFGPNPSSRVKECVRSDTSQSKRQLTSERYTEERIPEENKEEGQKNEEEREDFCFFTDEELIKLGVSITSKINQIQLFFEDEWKVLLDEKNNIDNDIKINQNLSEISQYKSAEKNYSSYNKLLDEDEKQVRIKDNNFKNKMKIYTQIKNIIEDTFDYIKHNWRSEFKKESINFKLDSVLQHIADYNKMIEEKKEKKHQKEKYLIESNNGLNYESYQPEREFTIPQRVNDPPIINVGNISSSFTNFYSLYDRNRLSEPFSRNQAYIFFNSKKNKHTVDSKLNSISHFDSALFSTNNFLSKYSSFK